MILSLIGYNGDFKQKAFVELLNTLREENANLFILDTTRIEVNSILEDCRIWLDKGSYDIDKASKVLRYCHKNGITASDVEAQMQGILHYIEGASNIGLLTLIPPLFQTIMITENIR